MTTYDLVISQQVAAGQESCLMVTPDLGSKVRVNNFTGSGASQPDAVIKLVWKFGLPEEVTIWTVKADGDAPTEFVLPEDEIDGVNKLAICLENASSYGLYLSSFANVMEY